MDKILKELKGHSGSVVLLMQDDTRRFVRKQYNVERNYERLDALKGFLPVPEIYAYDGYTLDMEYIHGLDMRNYLLHNDPSMLIDFLVESFETCMQHYKLKNYTETYNQMLQFLDNETIFPFTKQQLIAKLPKKLPSSPYHGDMTLENIIYSSSGFFSFIDPVTVKYDSYVFDVAKLRQDLDCKWFLRNGDLNLDPKLIKIKEEVLKYVPEAINDNLLILMLLRVYLHCDIDTVEYNLIVREVNRLWKS